MRSYTCFHVHAVYTVKCVCIHINCTECAKTRQKDNLRGYGADKIKSVDVLNPHMKLQQSKNDFSLVCMSTASKYCKGWYNHGMTWLHTCASFIIMWAKTWRNPTMASHSLLCARDCWLPVHGPWQEKPCYTYNKWLDGVKFWFVMRVLPECIQWEC